MTNRVGPKGQVVIPKEFRDELGINPGDEVIFWLEGGELHLKRARPESLKGRFKGSNLHEVLAEGRRIDREKEELLLRRFRS